MSIPKEFKRIADELDKLSTEIARLLTVLQKYVIIIIENQERGWSL